MRKLLIILCYLALNFNYALASENCFIAKENNKIIQQDGNCSKPYAPESTFKVALSLIGFDSGILKNENNPSWSLPSGVDPFINVCNGDHNPRTWMRDSCLWYSRILTTKLGMDKFQDYVTKLSYGNMDLSGGLTNAWVSSSLTISPDEQTKFLQNMIEHKFPLDKTTYEKTTKIMFIQEMPGGWKLYGKTGNGRLADNRGNKTDIQHGWFVGYIEKENRRIVFATHIVDTEKQDTFASFKARNEALIKLWYIINEIEKI